jgi:hypothetical protein
MENLEVEELESKISNINNAVITLKLAVFEVKCEKARKVLDLQIQNYTSSLRQMLLLLDSKRHTI